MAVAVLCVVLCFQHLSMSLCGYLLPDLNLPLCGLAFVFVLFFLRVRTPEGTVASKIKRVDWL